MDLKKQIKIALGINDSDAVKFEWQSKTEDGTILVSTADVLETGSDVSVLTEDGTTIPLPIGTYKTEDGVSFVVEEEGVVASVSESETEEKETTEETEASEELAKDDEEKKEEDEDEDEDEKDKDMADVEDWEGMEKRIQNLEDAVAKLKEDKVGGDEEEMVEELSEPGTNPKTITTKEVKEFSIEELKAENEMLKEKLAKLPADAPVNAEKFSKHGANETKKLSRKDYLNMSSSDRFLYDLQNN